MAICPVLRMGDPNLLRQADAVPELRIPDLDETIRDMVDTMRALDGAGLAAPQIGINQRIVVFEVESNPRYPDAEPVPLTVLINPEIEVVSYATEADWEGCLSVPGMRGLVTRYTEIRYRGLQADGSTVTRDAAGFHAREVQHEYDHLDGILYPMRITDMRNFGFEQELWAENNIAFTPDYPNGAP